MSHHCKIGIKRGFTLIEVLIALALSVMLAALLFSALHTYVISASTGHKHITAGQQAESAYQFIRDQLREAVPLVLNTTRKREILFYGDERTIVYVGYVPRHRSAGGLHRNALIISGAPPNQTLGFTYERLPAADGLDRETFITVSPRDARILVDAASIEYEYFGSAGNHADPQWFGEWPGEDRLPELIRIRIVKANDRYSPDIVVPIYANAPTKHLAAAIGQPAKWNLNDVIPGRSGARNQPGGGSPPNKAPER